MDITSTIEMYRLNSTLRYGKFKIYFSFGSKKRFKSYFKDDINIIFESRNMINLLSWNTFLYHPFSFPKKKKIITINILERAA